MRVFVLRPLVRKAKRLGIDDRRFLQAAQELADGKFDAVLGGGVYKQRIARPGGGKSGGARALIAFRKGDRTVFVEIFAKSELDNISTKALAAVRDVAAAVFGVDDAGIAALVQDGIWVEVTDSGEE